MGMQPAMSYMKLHSCLLVLVVIIIEHWWQYHIKSFIPIPRWNNTEIDCIHSSVRVRNNPFTLFGSNNPL